MSKSRIMPERSLSRAVARVGSSLSEFMLPVGTRDEPEVISPPRRDSERPEVIENLQELEDADEPYENMEEIWPDYPTDGDFFFEDESEY